MEGSLMGICASKDRNLWKWLAPRWLLLLLAGAFCWAGCDTSSGQNKISSSMFLAPIQGTKPSVAVVTSRLDLLRAMKPGVLDSTLANSPTTVFAMDRLSSANELGAVTLSDDLLVYETQAEGLLSLNMCEDSASADCGRVRLHYDAIGLETEQDEFSNISDAVLPVRLENGWILAFDSDSKNIVAFREEEPRTTVDGDGQVIKLGYRVPASVDGVADTKDKNFGRGNGVVLSIVIKGSEIREQLGVPAEPIVTRLFEIEPNKLLVFFKSTAVRAIHMLELEEVAEVRSFDLNAPADPDRRFPVKVLKGVFKLFPGPYLSYMTLQQVTGMVDVVPDVFQPILIPNAATGAVDSGVALIYEQASSTFFRMASARNTVTGEITGGVLSTAIPSSTFFVAIGGDAAGTTLTPPFIPTAAFYHPGKNEREILLFEESTNILFAYDYTLPLDRNLRVFASSSNVLLRRDASGRVANNTIVEPVLTYAIGDVRSNRLAFDQGLDQLLSISYTSGLVVTVVPILDIQAATGSSLADFTYVEPLSEVDVRAFDRQSSTLLKIQLDYAPLPRRIQ